MGEAILGGRSATLVERRPPGPLDLRVLGPVTGTVNGSPLPLGPARQSALLSVLLCRMNNPVPAEALIDEVWGEETPAGGRQLVSTYLCRLRRVFAVVPASDTVTITYNRNGYTLRAEPEVLDQCRFEDLLRRAGTHRAAGDRARSLTALREALAMWAGEPFSSLPGGLLAAERGRLRELHLSALESKLELELTDGNPSHLLGELRAAHLENPLNERLACLLMTALYRAGRQADALGVYFRTAALLDAELGVRPGPQLQDHHRAVLANDMHLGDTPDDVAVARWTVIEPGVRCDLPASTGSLVGRDAELARLTRSHGPAGGVRLVTVDGMPGIGKTGLIVRAAEALAASHPDGQLYLDLHGNTPGRSPLTTADALRTLLAATGQRAADLPPSVDERAALWRAATRGREVLVVLDDAVGDQQVAPLLPGAGGTVLVGSRPALGLHATDAVTVGPLASRPAAELFRRAAGRFLPTDADDPVLGAVLRSCEGHPLALLCAARWLRRNPESGVAQLAARLADPAAFAGLLGQMSTGKAPGDVALVTTSVDPLTADARRLLAYLVTGRPGAGRLPPDRAVLAADELVEANLVTRGADGTLAISRPVAACVRSYLSTAPLLGNVTTSHRRSL